MPDNDIQEVPAGSGRDINAFGGTVRDIHKEGLGWRGTWYDQRNKQDRNIRIDLDTNTLQMTITESGGGGNSPTQVWKNLTVAEGGKPYQVNGNVYSMDGVQILENGVSVKNLRDIHVTNLTLPS